MEPSIPPKKKIALFAHDSKKEELLAWVRENKAFLAGHEVYSIGLTVQLLEQELGLAIRRFQNGPLGRDRQIGAKIAEETIDCLIFFWDPRESKFLDTDLKALHLVTVVWNIPVAYNRSSADLIISSPLLSRAG